MDREHLFTSLKRQILQTPAYQWVPLFFPDKVERMCTLEDLAWWLGTIDCLAPSWGADSVALSHLSFLHFLLDFSYASFMRLLFFITNVDTPGFFLGRTHNDDSSLQPVNHYEASRAIAHAVQGQLHLRKAVAQYLIFEYNLAGYETLTLAE